MRDQLLVRHRDLNEAGRYRADVDPRGLATQSWAIGHGLVSLVTPGPLPLDTLSYRVPMLGGLFVSAGDEPDRSRTSVEQGWNQLFPRGIDRE